MTTLQERITQGLKFDSKFIQEYWNNKASMDDIKSAQAQHAELTAKVVPLLVEMAEELQAAIKVDGCLNYWLKDCECSFHRKERMLARLEAAFPEEGSGT